MPPSDAIPDDLEALRALVLEQQASMEQMRHDLAERDLEIEQLKAQIAQLKRMQFGRKSEKIERQIEQLESRLEDVSGNRGAADGVAYRERQPREALPPHLPREEHILEPEAICPTCGAAMRPLGEDVSEQLARIAAAFKVIRTIRRKTICPCCQHIAQPSAPSRPIERGIAHPSLLADILVSKFADHQPLYRQAVMAARDGVTLDTASMGRWVGLCGALLEPLVDALRQYVMAGRKLHADDTPIPVLEPGNKKTRTARLWVYVRDDRPAASKEAPAVWFAYSPNRRGEHPQRHLGDFTGILQADAYAGFNELYVDGRIREAACFAHVRRKFYDVHIATPSANSAEALRRIGELYAVEATLRGQPPAKRYEIRQAQSRPLLDALKAWLEATRGKLSAKSELMRAINYALNQWGALPLYCHDGMAEIDNNIAENALRCVALGRKNFLFAGSDAGGERAAAMYALIGTCKLNGVDPRGYLEYVLAHISEQSIARIDELLPWRVAGQLHALSPSPAPSG
jgi:transposase